MPLLLIPILLGAIAFGAYRLYASVAIRLGPLGGIAALVLATAAVVAVAAYFVRRYRLIHGKTVNGDRILELPGSWGRLTLDANRKQGSLDLHGLTAQFIFADIEDVANVERDGAQAVALRLRHAAQPEWHIPLSDGKQARRWVRILHLAAQQKL
jgi:hypothetical protein